ncbi:MAG: PH domain-containing protein [Candidatus Wildermuthbacteria bacterium]|nr:PH domain-containing protein [Candidatus Wildermuthbacteria bacterium]
MSDIITEKNYPVQGKWIFKSLIGFIVALVISVILLAFGYVNYYFAYVIIFTPIYMVVLVLRRANFHYSIEDKFLTVKQGILSRQQRHLPFGVVQHVFVKQDLIDRMFGLASVAVENASQGGGVKKIFGMEVSNYRREKHELIGFAKNKVSIPGLKKQDAETLKNIILQKIKENPLEDSQSGL